MSEDTLLTPPVKALLGTSREYKGSAEIGRTVIRRFARAVGDANPLYWDEEHARKTRYRGTIAPLTMIFETVHDVSASIGEDGVVEGIIPRGSPPFKVSIRGGNKYYFYQPVRPDDIISVREEITQIYERQGKAGPMLFVVTDITYYNQRGEKLGLNRETMIYPSRKAEKSGG